MAAKVKRERLIKTYGKRCFYSNIELDTSDLFSVNGFTIEHLLPVALFRNRKNEIPGNLVPAGRLLNCIIGNAPLKVKYAIREHLAKLHFFKLTAIEITHIHAKATLAFLDQYKINGLYPWC